MAKSVEKEKSKRKRVRVNPVIGNHIVGPTWQGLEFEHTQVTLENGTVVVLRKELIQQMLRFFIFEAEKKNKLVHLVGLIHLETELPAHTKLHDEMKHHLYHFLREKEKGEIPRSANFEATWKEFRYQQAAEEADL